MSPRPTMRLSNPSWRRTMESISAREASSTTSTLPRAGSAMSVMRASLGTGPRPRRDSVAVVVRLVRTLDVDAEVGGLLLGELGQLHAEGVEVQAGHLLVEVLGHHVHAEGVLVGLREELDLGEHLVGEGVRHDERG